MDKNLNNINNLVEFIRQDAEKSKGLLTFALHGNGMDHFNEDSYVDLDIMYVYKDEFLSEGLNKIRELFGNLCETQSSESCVFIYSLKSGPMHPLRKDKNSKIIDINTCKLIFFHVSVFDESSYRSEDSNRSPSKLLLNTWQNMNPIIGIPLKELRNIDRIDIYDVLNCKLGIKDCINMLKKRINGYWDYNDSNELIWCSDTFIDFDCYEHVVYSIKWCVFNSIVSISEHLPLNLEENSYDILVEKHLLSLDSINYFKKILQFGNNIQENRKSFTKSPDEFIKNNNIDSFLEMGMKILFDVEKRLQEIVDFKEKKLFFNYEGKIIPINLTFDMKKNLFEVISLKRPDKILVISDNNIKKNYRLYTWLKDYNLIEYFIDDENSTKSLSSLTALLDFSEKNEINMSSLIIMFGGGNVGNLGGVAAGLISRGISFIHIPTTLVAQLDSSIGAKQSVNGSLSKNRFGLFHNPEYIFINPLFNKTLSKQELKSGLIESLKHGFCQSNELIDKAVKFNINRLDTMELIEIIELTIQLKLEYMKTDPYENSLDQHLELGHKIGHALEYIAREEIPHGICVAFGMVAEAYAFFRQGLLEQETLDVIVNKTKLIVNVINISNIDIEDILKCVFYDNKRNFDSVPFVLLSSLQRPKSIKIRLNEEFILNFRDGVYFARKVFTDE